MAYWSMRHGTLLKLQLLFPSHDCVYILLFYFLLLSANIKNTIAECDSSCSICLPLAHANLRRSLWFNMCHHCTVYICRNQIYWIRVVQCDFKGLPQSVATSQHKRTGYFYLKTNQENNCEDITKLPVHFLIYL